MGCISYFVFEHPDLWHHEETWFKRWLGYYIAPYLIAGFILFPLYEWLKYKAFEVELYNKVIKFNGKLIDISNVNEISRIYVPASDSYKYGFYQVELGMANELVTIPMFFTPRAKAEFEQTLSDFCIENQVKLVTIAH